VPDVAAETVHHPVFARVWTVLARLTKDEERRRQLLAGARGRVIELGAGAGTNFAYYPPEVDAVVAVEPEPYLREQAGQAAAGAPVAIEVVEATADRVPFEDDSFDVAVTSLVLCTVPDQARALAELRRVLKPGGELRFFEHVRPEGRRGRLFARADRSGIYPRLAGGCHCSRRTEAGIQKAGYSIESIERFSELGIPHILGVGRA
jgi:SAM-dependent methyltransferase